MPRPRYGGDAEGADQVPGPIERLVPAEGAAQELGAGTDAVPEQADRPDQLVGLPASQPLVDDHAAKMKERTDEQERQDDCSPRFDAPARIASACDRRWAGAHVRARTGDLFLTKEVLCLLSYVGAPQILPERPIWATIGLSW